MIVRAAGPVTALIIGVALAATGSMVTLWLGKPLRDEAVASASWPTTDGRIVRSTLQQRRDDGAWQHTAEIDYEYEVAGTSFMGTRAWIGDDYWSSPGSEFRDAVQRYPVGRQVNVHYDPAEPARSVLEPGATWSSSIGYFVGLGLLIGGSLMLLAAIAPLLIMIVALAGSSRPEPRDEWHDFDRTPSPPSRGGRETSSRPVDDGDDGIRIG